MELVSGTKKKRVSHEGFFYIADYVRDVKTYMKCSVWRRNGCRGRGILREDVFTPTGAHNHAPSPSVIERAKARAEMKDRAPERLRMPLSRGTPFVPRLRRG